MEKALILIPFSQNPILFHDPDVDFPASFFFGSVKSIVQQSSADTLMAILRKNTQMIEFALMIVLPEQRIVPDDFSALKAIGKHDPAFHFQLIMQSIGTDRKSRKSRRIIRSKSKFSCNR